MANLTDYATSYFEWAGKALPQLKELLNTQQIAELEYLRKEFKIQEENFLMFVNMSIQLGKKITKRDYDVQKKLWPDKQEKDILRLLLVKDLSNDPELAWGATPTDLDQLIVLADEAMRNIHTLNQLTDYIASLERQSNPYYYSSTLAKRIDEIINKEKVINCPNCRQGLRIQEDQMDLKIKCPKCEHSFYRQDNNREASDDVQVTRVGPVNIPNPKNDITGWICVVAGGALAVYLWLAIPGKGQVSPIFNLFAFSVGGWFGWWLYKQLRE